MRLNFLSVAERIFVFLIDGCKLRVCISLILDNLSITIKIVQLSHVECCSGFGFIRVGLMRFNIKGIGMQLQQKNNRQGWVAFYFVAFLLCAETSFAQTQQTTTATPNIANIANSPTLSRIQQLGVVTIAHREASLPFSYVNELTKEPIGFSIDLCLKIIETMRRELKLPKLEIKYVQVTPANRFLTLQAGKADMECGSTTNTPERRKEVSFAIPHFIDGTRLMSKNKALDELHSLIGRKVVALDKTNAHNLLQAQNQKHLARIEIVASKDHKESFERLSQGQAEVWVTDGTILASSRASATAPSEYFISEKLFTIEPLAIAFAKDDEALGDVINREMRRLMLNGEFSALYKKWFQASIPPKGINLNAPMNVMLRSFIKQPTAKLPENF